METIIKAVILYIVVFFASRAVFSREIKETGIQTSLDMLLMVIFGSMATLATLAGDYSLTNTILSIATLALVHAFVMYLKPKVLK